MAPIAVAIGLLLTFPVVHNGLDLDDYFHRALLTDTPRFSEHSRGPQAMFRFLNGRSRGRSAFNGHGIPTMVDVPEDQG